MNGLAADDPIMDSMRRAQRTAARVGRATLAVEVFGWAIKHALLLPAPALKELLDMLTGDDEA